MFFIMSIYLFLMSLLTSILTIMFLLTNFKIIIEWNLMSINSMKMIYIMYLDWMSLMFFSTIFLISSTVILYSINYMSMDMHIKRFMLLINIFIMSMILMIISPNMISILIGWDGLGLSSYCLVAYYLNKKSFNSSMVTILMNRIGDIMILILIGLFMKFGSWNFMFMKKINSMFFIFITLAAITKSAQIPFSSWLPMAMAAPTPISSLVHSSTLVTAGVYLLIRFNYLMNNKIMYMIMILSCLTMFIANFSANMEFDLKKIIALSTLSQLGLMIMTISMNYPKLSFFHLITHAMFKSLLFLCSGIMIHNYFNMQDIRMMSFTQMNMPYINLIFNTASLSLCGMPFMSGFYSKDLIIETFTMNQFNWMIFFLMFMSMGLTISYTSRLIFYLSMKNKMYFYNFYKSMNLMNYSIIMLVMMTLFYGSILNWLLFSSLNNIFLPKKLKLLIYLFLMMGMISGMILSKFKLKIYEMMIYYYYIFNNMMWFLPNLYNNKKLLNFNNYMVMHSDSSWMELISSKFYIYLMKLLFNKKIYRLNFFLLMLMLTHFIIILMII
uniref:NADH-ubiquinone oxidoreductase chain 5 n=1 Tax=Diachasmimorpha longicaudata TaxID=58733 RepID=D8WHC0_9HYME|nr:NADH dehydrogenase subunit 5 [Diachasmimorpha longicaudata]